MAGPRSDVQPQGPPRLRGSAPKSAPEQQIVKDSGGSMTTQGRLADRALDNAAPPNTSSIQGPSVEPASENVDQQIVSAVVPAESRSQKRHLSEIGLELGEEGTLKKPRV